MTRKKLEAESMRIVRLLEPSRISLGVEQALALLIKILTPPRAKPKPPPRENPYAPEKIDRILRESVFCSAAHVGCRPKFQYRLDVTINRKVNCDSRQ